MALSPACTCGGGSSATLAVCFFLPRQWVGMAFGLFAHGTPAASFLHACHAPGDGVTVTPQRRAIAKERARLWPRDLYGTAAGPGEADQRFLGVTNRRPRRWFNCSRSTWRRILPLGVFGSSSTKTTSRG